MASGMPRADEVQRIGRVREGRPLHGDRARASRRAWTGRWRAGCLGARRTGRRRSGWGTGTLAHGTVRCLDLLGEACGELIGELAGDVGHDAPAELGRLASDIEIGQDLDCGVAASTWQLALLDRGSWRR